MEYILLHTVPFGLTCIWWWVWSLVAMLLGCLICRLFSSREDRTEEINKLTAERDKYHTQATKWESDYASLRYQLEESQKAEADLRAALQNCEADKQTLRYQMEKAATGLGIAGGIGEVPTTTAIGFAGLFSEDNLQIIEGIGPKIETVLHDAGYHNWEQLAAAETDTLRTILDNAGSRFKLADPTSWPHQASLAAAGNWDELIRYQKFTDAGRETVGDFETPSKFEKMATKKMGFPSINPTDLKVVEGIGPKIEGLFKEAGISNWDKLAAATTNQMQEILDAAGDRYKLADPGTWAQQAQLAIKGDWVGLADLQASLKGGN